MHQATEGFGFEHRGFQLVVLLIEVGFGSAIGVKDFEDQLTVVVFFDHTVDFTDKVLTFFKLRRRDLENDDKEDDHQR